MADVTQFGDWLESLNWINKGDCLYVTSDMLELAKAYRAQGQRLVMDVLLDKLQQLVGAEGTILLPAFNFDFCKGIAFDYHKTPSRTGSLANAALKRADFSRTAHPFYSFAVWGAKQEELLQNASVDAFGPGTIFEKVYQWDAKFLAIGIPALKGATYVHHVEHMVGVPFRFHKAFTADYIDAQGVREQRTYRMYVRDYDMDPQEIDGCFRPLGEQMHREGLIATQYYENNLPCHLLKIVDLHAAVERDILENDCRNLYHYKRSL